MKGRQPPKLQLSKGVWLTRGAAHWGICVLGTSAASRWVNAGGSVPGTMDGHGTSKSGSCIYCLYGCRQSSRESGRREVTIIYRYFLIFQVYRLLAYCDDDQILEEVGGSLAILTVLEQSMEETGHAGYVTNVMSWCLAKTAVAVPSFTLVRNSYSIFFTYNSPVPRLPSCRVFHCIECRGGWQSMGYLCLLFTLKLVTESLIG